jgi:hypothetical protein
MPVKMPLLNLKLLLILCAASVAAIRHVVVRHAARFELKDALFQAAEPRAEPPAACRRSRC